MESDEIEEQNEARVGDQDFSVTSHIRWDSDSGDLPNLAAGVQLAVRKSETALQARESRIDWSWQPTRYPFSRE